MLFYMQFKLVMYKLETGLMGDLSPGKMRKVLGLR